MNSENFDTILPDKEKYLPSAHVGIPGTQGEARRPRILLAPLDWGLGHATRCIPVIYELLGLNCEIWLGAEKAQEMLLKQEFPHLPVLQLPGYGVKYARSAAATWWNLGTQFGKILQAIRSENNWLKEKIDEYHFDAVISDNRFGLHHEKIPCVFITHQLAIKSPLGKWSERFLQKRNYNYINRFSECWVPDEQGEDNLAGELSHPITKPAIPVYYVGPLSRLKKTNAASAQKDNLLVLLSGPEPQRSILENKIISDIVHYSGRATIVRGLPGSLKLIPSTNTIKFYNHLASPELSKEIDDAEYVIARSGYSTIMDIVKLQKKTILIPTPGQTEQEYLASYLKERNVVFSIPQKAFSLSSALQSAGLFPYDLREIESNNSLRPIVSRFVETLHRY